MRSTRLIFFIFITGCAAYKSYNQTTLGKVALRGGVYEKKAWNEVLLFNRMSWYHGMTLYFDALLWKASEDSPFSQWFSAQEREYFDKCETLLVSAGYSADPLKISHVNFREQMRLNGYDDVVINTFASALKTHPSAQDWRLQNYKIMGYCKRSPSRYQDGILAINFPSFKQLEVKL